MKLRTLFFACLVLAGCSSKVDEDLPPAATFDAAADTGGRKDSGSPLDAVVDSFVDTGLLADASDVMSETPDCITGKTCVGSEMPTWMLQDFQPKSPRFNTTYGLSTFKGKVTVVALLSGW